MRSYSRNISTLATNKSLIEDLKNNFVNISEVSLYKYINALTRLYVIDDVSAWNPSIRSASAIRAANKKELIDPSLVVASLNLSPSGLIKDLNTFGFIFETLCFRDLKIYASKQRANVYYYRDRYGLEADCVLCLDNGQYALIEFKLGSRQIEEGSKHLIKLKELIVSKMMKKPDLLIVITVKEIAYKRDDGVCIIPFVCLKD